MEEKLANLLEQIKNLPAEEMSKVLTQLPHMLEEQPSLAPTILRILNTAIASGRHNETSLRSGIEAIAKIYRQHPYDFSAELLESLLLAASSDQNSRLSVSKIKSLTGDITKYRQKFSAIALKINQALIQTGKGDNQTLEMICRETNLVLLNQPQQVDSVMKIYQNLLPYCRQNLPLVKSIIDGLENVSKKVPKFDMQVIDLYKYLLNQNYLKSSERYNLYINLMQIIDNHPKITSEVLSAIEYGATSSDNDAESLAYLYRKIKEFGDKHPQHSVKVFDILNQGLKSARNDDDSVNQGYAAILSIVQKKPDLAEKALETLSSLLNTAGDYRHRNILMNEILHVVSQTRPDLKAQIFATVFKAHEISSTNQFHLLRGLIDFQLMANLHQKFPAHKPLIKALYLTRHCHEKEATYLINNYDLNQIGQLNLSGQQRTMNVLMGMLCVEQKLGEDKGKGWRKKDDAEVSHIFASNADW